ncbi:MAG: hypothetical protein AAF583_14980 [Pseudomonadota bacterium]
MSVEDFGEKRRFPWIAVIVGLVLFGLFGSCSWVFVGILQNAVEVRPLDDSFVAEALETGLPAAGDDIYSEFSGVAAGEVSAVNTMIENLGQLNELGEASCQANSSASTDSLSGHFVTCNRVSVFAVTQVAVSTTWRLEDEVWKLLAFNLNLADIGAYTDAVAKNAISNATKTGSK